MKSRINDERYNKYKQHKEYDRIVLSCINMVIENAAKEKKKRIILRDVNGPSFPFMLHTARAAMDVTTGLKQELYVQCKLREYFKVKKKYPNFDLKWTRGPHLCATGEKPLLAMVAKWHKIEDNLIFEKIFEEFYNIEKIRKESADEND